MCKLHATIALFFPFRIIICIKYTFSKCCGNNCNVLLFCWHTLSFKCPQHSLQHNLLNYILESQHLVPLAWKLIIIMKNLKYLNLEI